MSTLKNTSTHISDITDEERLVAELELLGIHYLSRQSTYRAATTRPSSKLFADLNRQPSARVRSAIIAVLLSHPEFAATIQDSLLLCSTEEKYSLYHLYTAATLLQCIYRQELEQHVTSWSTLPDLFSEKLNLPQAVTPQERLIILGKLRNQQTGSFVNWTGTYHDVAKRLLHRWELETAWTS